MENARTFTLVRHGRTTYNHEGRVNGDPRAPVHLDEEGRRQMLALRGAAAATDVDLAIRSRFPRTAESLALLLDGRDVPIEVYPELDDVRLGGFEGGPVGDYRAWRNAHRPDEPPPGEGESRIDALYRYLRGFERMLDEDATRILAVIHDVPIRFMLNGRLGADPLDGPVRVVANAEVHVLGEEDVRRGLDAMRERLGM